MVYAQPSICPVEWYIINSFWDFGKQTDHLIWVRQDPELIDNQQQKKKRICQIVNFAVPADCRMKLIESDKKDSYLDLAREFKKLWNMKVTIIPIVIGASLYSNWRTIKGTGGLENCRTSGDHPNNSLDENSQNTKKSFGDLRRLAVIQTLVKDH